MLAIVLLALNVNHPSTEHFDVVVVGGTPGGSMSAVAAARSGAGAVALLEPTPYIGGMMASGLGLTDFGVRADTIGGLAREFFRRVATHYNTSECLPCVLFAYIRPQYLTTAVTNVCSIHTPGQFPVFCT